MMETTLFIIKPEGMQFRGVIRSRVVESGLVVRRSVVARLSEFHVAALYPDLSPDLRRATANFVLSGDCEICEVVGENAVRRLLEVVGHATDPNECSPGTLRKEFGCKVPECVGSAIYFRNAIHRPKDSEEAQRDCSLLASLLDSEVSIR